jgi:Flp pilus assembly protein TadG
VKRMEFKMKKILQIRNREIAQVIPIVVIGLVGLVAMSALIIDGGALMMNRRSAQNAADAGALAGARELCLGKGVTAAKAAAIQYAVTENHATSATADVKTENVGVGGLSVGEVVVTAEMAHDSFFAKIFNQNTLTSNATAGAGCYPPGQGNYVMPIAWSCRPPIGGSMSTDCEYVKLDYLTQVKPIEDLYKPNQTKISTNLFNAYQNKIYIMMDSEKVCGVDINCDFNGDGRAELESGGNRGWLNLDGGSAGASTLSDWIENGLDRKINVHTWLSGVNGNKTSVYSSMETRIGQIVWVPVFNMLCDELPKNDPACLAAAHANTPPGLPLEAGEVDTVLTGSPATPLYHVVGLAPFYITCVHKSKEPCPGFDKAMQVNPSIKESTNTVEGYFVNPSTLPSDDVGPGGVDLGVYTVSLSR